MIGSLHIYVLMFVVRFNLLLSRDLLSDRHCQLNGRHMHLVGERRKTICIQIRRRGLIF